MSIKAMTWAFDQPLAGNEKVVLLALADAAHDDGVCWPSVPRLAEKAYVSERTVQRVMQTLIEQGYVSTVARNHKNGRTAANIYLLQMDEGDKLTPYLPDDEGEGDSLSEGDNSVTGEGDNCVTPLKETKHRTVTNKDRRRGTPVHEMPDDFSPNDTNQALAASLNFSWPEVLDQIERMRHWSVNAGSLGLKRNWQSAFNKWLRTAAERRKANHSNGPSRQRPSTSNQIDELWRAIEAGENRLPQERADGGGENTLALPGLWKDVA